MKTVVNRVKIGCIFDYNILNINVLKIKYRKSLKKCVGCMVCVGKILFLQSPIGNGDRASEMGVVNRGLFIERMKECSKYSS